MRILKLEPIFKQRIWGGRQLEKTFDYTIPEGNVGECWAISGHKHGASKIISAPYHQLTLDQVYEKYKNELFNHDKSDQFPLLIKILDANDDLSIQVHPDDAYAQTYENDLGKTECWYVLDASKNAKIIDGHNASNKDEFLDRLKHNDLTLWHEKEIKKGDFISIPSKKVHAIGKGALIYEVQQSSDTTYRIYDYDRKQADGTKRQLHLDKALDIIDIPSTYIDPSIEVKKLQNATKTTFIKNEYFEFTLLDISDSMSHIIDRYQLCSVIEGEGLINDTLSVRKGDHFVICDIHETSKLSLSGHMKLTLIQRPTQQLHLTK